MLLMLMAPFCEGVQPIDPECFHCLRKFYECYEKNGCARKANKNFSASCKREYDECIKFCNMMLKRLRTDDFPVIRHEIGRDKW